MLAASPKRTTWSFRCNSRVDRPVLCVLATRRPRRRSPGRSKAAARQKQAGLRHFSQAVLFSTFPTLFPKAISPTVQRLRIAKVDAKNSRIMIAHLIGGISYCWRYLLHDGLRWHSPGGRPAHRRHAVEVASREAVLEAWGRISEGRRAAELRRGAPEGRHPGGRPLHHARGRLHGVRHSRCAKKKLKSTTSTYVSLAYFIAGIFFACVQAFVESRAKRRSEVNGTQHNLTKVSKPHGRHASCLWASLGPAAAPPKGSIRLGRGPPAEGKPHMM